MIGRRARLQPIGQPEADLLYKLELSGLLSFRWNVQGITPSPEEFRQSLWAGVLATYAVIRRSDDVFAGVVTAYGSGGRGSIPSRIVYLAAGVVPEFKYSALGVEAVGLFIEYCFRNWDIRKIYLETLDVHAGQFLSGLSRLGGYELFVQEGRLLDWTFVDGRYADKLLLALTRERWSAAREALLPRLLDLEPKDHDGSA